LAQVAAQQPAKVDARAELASKIPGAKADDLRPSPIPGVYELMRGTDIAYVSTDGKYVIDGDLYDLASSDNLTETRRRGARVRLLSDVPESEMLVFSPRDPKHTITVFTDIDCGYCRKLHTQIAEYNRRGIKVRYLFYPRSGPDTESWEKAVEVWCSPNRNEALTRAKRGDELGTKPCAKSPVERHYNLGQEFALRGTPAIILANGELLPGYVSPAMLADHLKGK
ncbi:MAG TPA: DsbC family protein, partial [Steroidobacteraceae bacterium]|nr:DsbC family protein [Steroidobacteraceae bacterium]